jgi:hypothetical protein
MTASTRFRRVSALSALAAVIASSSPVFAQTVAPVTAVEAPAPTPAASTQPELANGALIGATRMPEDRLRAFLANPSSLLTLPGNEVAEQVRLLVGSSKDTLEPVVSPITAETPAPTAFAIGQGLARAARIYLSSDPEYSAAIATRVAEANIKPLTDGFQSITGDVETAAIGATGATGGGGLGGSSLGGAGGVGGGDAGTPSGDASSPFFSRSTTGTTTISVSPSS